MLVLVGDVLRGGLGEVGEEAALGLALLTGGRSELGSLGAVGGAKGSWCVRVSGRVGRLIEGGGDRGVLLCVVVVLVVVVVF